LQGREIDLLSPFERVEPVLTRLDPKRAGPLQEWLLYHRAFLLEQALGPFALQAVQPGRLDIAPYQIVPVMRALSLTRPRLLLADGVGLGKTIEAGLVIAELIARRRAHRVLIVSPPGPLMLQWQDEMRQRFGLRFEVIRDSATLQEKRRGLVVGANPFDHIGLCLLSVDFGKQDKVMLDLERSNWDLVIIDEAHHCVQLGGAGDREDSRRRRLAELLARQGDGLLLLTATPHDGYDEHFASLLELLDPSLVDGRAGIRGDGYRRHVVRRLKHHIKKPGTNEPLFRERQVLPRPVAFGRQTHPDFSTLQEALLALVAPRLKQALRRKQYGDVLAFVSLLKRSVSTVRACQNTLEVIADRYAELIEKGQEEDEARQQRLRTLSDYRRRMERYGALSADDEADQALLEAEDMAAHLRANPPANELKERLTEATHELRLEARRAAAKRKALDQTHGELLDLVLLAEVADGEDPKVSQVIEEVKAIRAAEPTANVLVYTEYSDSQIAVTERLREAIDRGALDGEVLTIEGEDSEKVREERIARFGQADAVVLVSTDATAEGLNLHERCHHLIHLELPYNPNRLEQRNGRIDRYGQTRDPIVRYLYLAGTFEERVLLRLIAKYEKQRARLTFVPNTLGLVVSDQSAATRRLLDGLAEEEGTLFKREGESERLFEPSTNDSDVSSPAYQELLAEMDRAIGGFEKAAKTHAWLGGQGLNADPARVEEADRAKVTGERLGGLDLLGFVTDAVQADARAASAVTEIEPDVLSITLPHAWRHGIDDVPGWNPAAGRLLVTKNASVVRTTGGESVGFLGRAHPVVRRALDRVRNLPVLSGASTLDRRVSVVTGDELEMLFTFLCTVRSAAGRELERVMAVRVTPDGEPAALSDPPDWLSLAARNRQTATKGVWEQSFAGWSNGQEERCRRAAARAFEAIYGGFSEAHIREVSTEKLELSRWLADRAEALCGPRRQEAGFDRQLGLGFDSGQLELRHADVPRWKISTDPVERLASLKADGNEPPAARQEADGVLQLYNKRTDRLERRSELEPKAPQTLGLLLVVLKKAH
jgi:ERCC4-related helicase